MCPTKSIHRFLHKLARARIVFTAKATDEILDRGWDTDWALEVVRTLRPEDYERCEDSQVIPGDVVWVFCPELEFGPLWIRLVDHGSVIVVSFHPAGEP